MRTFYFNLWRVFFLFVVAYIPLRGLSSTTLPDSLSVQYVATQPNCNGDSNGNIDITVTGGNSPYIYQWSSGESTEDLIDIPAGNYSLTVTDSGTGQIPNFNWTYANTGANHSVMVPTGTVMIDGVPIAIGDYVGLFYTGTNGLTCGGYKQWTGASTAIPAWGAEAGNTNGFAIGESFSWKVWRTADGTEIDMVATYQSGLFSDTVWTHNGMCIVSSLIGSSPAGQGNLSTVVEIEVSQPTPLGIAGSLSDYNGYSVSSHGATDGSIDLNIWGGVVPYMLMWSHGETTELVTGLGAGNYTVTVTDLNLCTSSMEFVLTQPDIVISPMSVSSQVTALSCNAACDGAIDLSVSGGISPYYYSWSNGASTADLNNLCAGNYDVTVSYNSAWNPTIPFNWNYSINSANHVILLQQNTITVNGQPLDAGDYIGVFYDSLGTSACGGYIAWDGSNTAITAWGAQNSQVNGFASGEEFSFKVYKAAEQMVVDMTPTFAAGFSHIGYYSPNGLSGLQSLTGTMTYQMTPVEISESFVLTQPDALHVSFSTTNSNLITGVNGAVDLDVVGGTSPYIYAWSNGSATQDITNLTAGAYSVTVTDANGCTVTGNAVVDLVSPISITYTVSDFSGFNISTNGATDGWIDLSVTGGAGSYTFAWSNGATAEDISSLAAGDYVVSVNDVNNIPATATIVLTEPAPAPDPLTAIVTTTDVSCYSVCDGQIDIAPIGGTTPYTFLWSDNSIMEDRTGLCAGTYSVTINDSGTSGNVQSAFDWTYENTGMNHSILVADSVVSINGQGLAIGDYIGVFYNNGGDLVCGGYKQWLGSTTVVSAWGTTPGAKNGFDTGEEFHWKVWRSSSQMTVDMTASYQTTFSNGGAYITNGMSAVASLTGVFAPGTSSQQIVLTAIVNESPQVLISGAVTDVQCFGSNTGSIDVTVTNAEAPISYLWSNNQQTQDIGNLSAGNYSLEIVDGNGCVHTASFTVSGLSTIEVVATLSDYNGYEVSALGASDGFINLNVTGGQAPYTYAWSNGASGANVSNLAAGIYEVTIVDAVGCIMNSVYALEQPAQQVSPIVITTIISDASTSNNCDGNIDISVTGGTSPYEFLWSNGATTEDLVGLCAGNYSVTITDSGNLLKSLTGFNWTYVNTGVNHSVFVPGNGVTIDGFPITNDDYVGIFYNNNGTMMCAGYKQWNGNNTAIAAWGAQSGSTNGFSLGEQFEWRVWRQADSIEVVMDATYETQGFANQQYYVPNGMSGIATLTGSAQSNTGAEVLIESFNVSEPTVPVAPLSASHSIAPIDCFGNCNGGATLVPNGGVSPYFFQWSNGATTSSVSGLCAGIYSATVYDSNIPSVDISDWSYQLTGINHTVAIPAGSVTIDGQPLVVGDYIGVFYSDGNNLVCGGYVDYQGSTTGVAAWGAINSLNNGFAIGESFSWKVLRSADNTTVDMVATYSTLFPQTGNYLTNGISSIATLTGSTAIPQMGDSTVLSVSIADPAQLVATATETMVSCFGLANGAINLSVSGGTSPYTVLWSNNETTEDIDNLVAGTYSVSVTDANGCQTTGNYTIFEPSALSATASETMVSCFGLANGAIDLSVSGGTSPYTVLWSNNETTEDIDNLVAGTYSVSVTDAKGCQTTENYTIFEPSALSATASETMVSCFGLANGAIDLSVSGGTSPYTVLWSNNETTGDIDNLVAGTYSVSVTDANGCQTTGNYTIFEPSALSATASETMVSCFGLANGAIDLSVSGGTSPYTVLWSNNETTEDIDNLVAGTYSVSVTDANGCQTTGNYTIFEPSALSATATETMVSCFGLANGAIDLSVSGGTSPYTVLWSNNETTEDIDNLVAGTYSVSVTDANGCQTTGNYTIFEPSALSATASESMVSCFGLANGAIDLSVSGGTSPFSVLWSNNETTEDIDNLVAGTYSVSVTDANGCQTTGNYTIFEPSALSATASETMVSCFGLANGAIDLSVSGGTTPYTVLWSNNETTEDIDNLVAGTYSVSVTDANGCQATGNYTIFEPSALSATATETMVSCFGLANGAIDLSVSGGTTPYTLLWSNNETSEDIDNLVAGTYSVSVTDANGCQAFGNYVVAEPSELTIQLQANDLNCYESQDGSVVASVNGGTPGFNYLWSNTETVSSIDMLDAGSYSLTVTDANQCTQTAEAYLMQPMEVVVDAGDNDTINMGESYVVSATAGFASYLWNTGETTQNITVSDEGSYIVTVTTVDGCQGVDSMYLTVNPYLTQVLIMKAGWSMVSLNVVPPDLDITVVFQDILDNVTIAKNGQGQMWWPYFNLNLIGDISLDEGYQFNMAAEDTAYIQGLIADPQNIPIIRGANTWSMISYLRQQPADVYSLMSSINGSINIIKDYQGKMYWPYFNLNLIGDMVPGQGYQINTLDPITYYYPANSTMLNKSTVFVDAPQYYKTNINTASNMTLGIPETAWGIVPEYGDEIGVFTTNGELAGSAVFAYGHTAITIWGDDMITYSKELFAEGDVFEIRVWNAFQGTETVLVVEEWLDGSGQYAENTIAMVGKLTTVEPEMEETGFLENYPNPFSSFTNISFSIATSDLVRISIYNMQGELVSDLCNHHFEAGTNTIQFDGTHLPSGIYNCRMESNNRTHVRQVNILH